MKFIFNVHINTKKAVCGNCKIEYTPILNPKWALCNTCFDLPVIRKKDGSFGFGEKK